MFCKIQENPYKCASQKQVFNIHLLQVFLQMTTVQQGDWKIKIQWVKNVFVFKYKHVHTFSSHSFSCKCINLTFWFFVELHYVKKCELSIFSPKVWLTQCDRHIESSFTFYGICSSSCSSCRFPVLPSLPQFAGTFFCFFWEEENIFYLSEYVSNNEQHRFSYKWKTS